MNSAPAGSPSGGRTGDAGDARPGRTGGLAGLEGRGRGRRAAAALPAPAAQVPAGRTGTGREHVGGLDVIIAGSGFARETGWSNSLSTPRT